MNMQDTPLAIGTRLREILLEELGLEPSEVTEDLSYGSIPEWDSVGHMHLVAALEESFEFNFADEEISTLTTLALIEQAVARHVAAAGNG